MGAPCICLVRNNFLLLNVLVSLEVLRNYLNEKKRFSLYLFWKMAKGWHKKEETGRKGQKAGNDES